MPRRRPPQVHRFEPAPQDRLADVEHLAPRFFRDVLGWEYEECPVTDESELSDFATCTSSKEERAAEVDAFLARLREHYIVDGRQAGSTRIVDLLEFLKAHGVTE
jgi:hypothetical protein